MWNLKTFNELTNQQLYQILKERVAIFVVEQDCPYPELDDYDQQSFHLFYEIDEQIVAYLRVVPPGVKYTEASIGRVIVKQTYRGTGLGKELFQKGMETVQSKFPERNIKIQAQEYLLAFYRSFGFQPISEVYLEDNIPHLDMLYIAT